jgi:hypothetical protein
MTSNLDREAGGGTPLPAETAPAYALFDYRAVMLATFPGTPLAGSLLMAVNCRRLGRMGAAAAILAAGVVLTAGFLFLAFGTPLSGLVKLKGFLALPVMAMVICASGLQGKALDRHVSSGGKLGSFWAACGLGVALLGPVLYLIATQAPPPSIFVGTKDNVFYSGAATRQDAQVLGRALAAAGYFVDQGAAAGLTKDQRGSIISFVVRDGSWNDAALVDAFYGLAHSVAPSAGGLPLKFRLVDSKLRMKKQMLVE